MFALIGEKKGTFMSITTKNKMDRVVGIIHLMDGQARLL